MVCKWLQRKYHVSVFLSGQRGVSVFTSRAKTILSPFTLQDDTWEVFTTGDDIHFEEKKMVSYLILLEYVCGPSMQTLN